MPLNAAALDEEDALMMLTWYPDQWYRLHFDPASISTRSRQERRLASSGHDGRPD
jgi:hypothetical protein